MASIGENIKRLRSEKGLTQKALADLLGTSQQNLAQYEKDKRKPKFDTIRKLAEALQVDYKDIDENSEVFVTFKPPSIDIVKLFAGSGGLKIDDADLNDFLQEHIDYYKNIVFEWADSRDYEYKETSDAIYIFKNDKSIKFTEQDVDLLQDFIDNYLDVQLERKIKELESSDSEQPTGTDLRPSLFHQGATSAQL